MPHLIHLDARLSLAYELYDSCDLAADIGTDHAHLPAALLQRGRCQYMILTDISGNALQNARNEIIRFNLSKRVAFRTGDGLMPLNEECGMISVTGMGGRTIHDILLCGREKLRGASLILSAHTDLPLIREAIAAIGYHAEREEPCYSAGRWYLVIRARPGIRKMSPREIRLGGPLFDGEPERLIPYIIHRRKILQNKLLGMLSAKEPNRTEISLLRDDMDYYSTAISKMSSSERSKKHDSSESV